MTREQVHNYGGVNFVGALLIVFIVLKLCGVIGWSWWWVLCPLWIPFALAGAIIAICVLCLAIWSLIQWNKERLKGKE